MRSLRVLSLLAILFSLVVTSQADIDGPTPLAWRWASGGGIPTGRPVLDNGVVYITLGTHLFALHADTGNEAWKFPTTEDVAGTLQYSPVISGTTLVIPTQSWVYGLDTKTGHEKWHYRVMDPRQGLGTQPVLAGNSVLFQLSGGPEGDFILALNVADGKPSWVEPLHVFDNLKGDLASNGSMFYFFTQADDLWMGDVNDPRKAHKVEHFDSVSSSVSPVVYGDVLYINSSTYVTALNAFNGQMRWERNTEQDLAFGPAASAEGVAAISRDGVLTVMDPNGHIKSMRNPTTKTSSPMQVDLGSGPAVRPTAAGKYFVAPTIDGALNLIDAESGALAWSYRIPPMTEITPEKAVEFATAAANGLNVTAIGPAIENGDTLLVLCSDGSLLCFDKKHGVDLTGPNISMLTPGEGAQVNGDNLQVAFFVNDTGSGVNPNTVKVLLNGQPFAADYVPTGLIYSEFTQYAANKPLPDGRAQFEVTATDWMGNATTKEFTLSVDNSLLPLAPVGPLKPKGGKGLLGTPP